MLGAITRGHTRGGQRARAIAGVWASQGLNSVLIPLGNQLIEAYNPAQIIGSGGVQTGGATLYGNAVARVSGNYDFTNFCQTQSFSRVAVIRQASTAEAVISIGRNAGGSGGSQFSTLSGEINLTESNIAILGTSTGAGLVTGKTSVIGLTYDQTTGVMFFYVDGRYCGTASVITTFINDGTGRIFSKGDGGNPFTGDLSLHLDFTTVLDPAQMLALTENPYQVFAPSRELWVTADAAAGSTGTVATTNADDTPSAAGTTTVTGTSATTNLADTSAASGTTTITGTSATTNADDTAAATGAVGGAISGTVSYTNIDDSGSAAGTTTVTGTSDTTNLPDTSNASGVVGAVSGTSSTTNNDDTASATGTAGDFVPDTHDGIPQFWLDKWQNKHRKPTKKELVKRIQQEVAEETQTVIPVEQISQAFSSYPAQDFSHATQLIEKLIADEEEHQEEAFILNYLYG